MMGKPKFLAGLMLFTLLPILACQLVSPSGKKETPVSTIKAQEFSTPSLLPDSTETLAPSPSPYSQSGFYEKKCITISSDLSHLRMPENSSLVLEDSTNTILRWQPAQDTPQPFPELDDDRSIVGISPTGGWIAYYVLEDGNINALNFLQPATGETRFVKLKEGFYNAYWSGGDVFAILVNPNHLLVMSMEADAEIQEIEFPADRHLDLSSSKIIVSKKRDALMYQRSAAVEFPSIVFWDQANQQELWKVEIEPNSLELIRRALIQVSPDGTQFAVAAPEIAERPVMDIFLLTEAGKTTQLTHFQKEHLGHALIENLSWSPDGKHLAFWLNDMLAVANIKTGKVVDYCLRGRVPRSFPGYWSPDSKKLVFNLDTDTSTGPGFVTILDLEQAVAFNIFSEEYFVDGWVLDQPAR